MLRPFVRRIGVATVLVGFLFIMLSGCALFPQPPVASFVVEYNVTADVLVVNLNAAGSSDPNDDAIVSYMWAFDDDVDIVSPLDYSKTLPTPLLQARFPDEGEYTIQLLVVDDTGAMSAPVSQTITLPVVVMAPTQ
ncbi:PKD domain-containing protein [Candidatus Bipolaricaulota bacterium]|nr:PKD domain-containing protein [Candidatus Bipolaricaulota bacterium]